MLRFAGFCGVDDTISPEHLRSISAKYPWVEWGICFLTGKEGQPRFASPKWVRQFLNHKDRSV